MKCFARSRTALIANVAMPATEAATAGDGHPWASIEINSQFTPGRQSLLVSWGVPVARNAR
jgi:hypothetical protein